MVEATIHCCSTHRLGRGFLPFGFAFMAGHIVDKPQARTRVSLGVSVLFLNAGAYLVYRFSLTSLFHHT